MKSFILGFWMMVVALVAGAETNAPQQIIRIAKPAPQFELKDLQGRKVKLSDFDGVPVIVCFWASWDRPSQRQMEPLTKFHGRYASNELAVVGVALDTGDIDVLRQRAKEWGVNFPVLQFDLKVNQDFGGIEVIPTTFMIDKNHNIIQRYPGFVESRVLEDDLKMILRK